MHIYIIIFYNNTHYSRGYTICIYEFLQQYTLLYYEHNFYNNTHYSIKCIIFFYLFLMIIVEFQMGSNCMWPLKKGCLVLDRCWYVDDTMMILLDSVCHCTICTHIYIYIYGNDQNNYIILFNGILTIYMLIYLYVD